MDSPLPVDPTDPPLKGSRSFWFQVHFWLGWLAALPIMVVCLTGGALVFEEELNAWEHQVSVPAEGKRLEPAEVIQVLASASPPMRVNHLQIPKDPTVAYGAFITETPVGGPNRSFPVSVDPYTGKVTKRGEKLSLSQFLVALHRNLSAGPTGQTVVGVSSLVLLVTSLIGLVVWWPMRGGTLGRAWRRGRARDWHNAVGLVALAPLAVMALTGITFTWGKQIFPVLEKVQGGPVRQMAPKVVVPEGAKKLPLTEVMEAVAASYPGAKATGLQPSNFGTSPHQIFLESESSRFSVWLDPYTGKEIGRMDGKGTGPFGWYQRNFGRIHSMQPYGKLAQVIWGALSVAGAFLAGSGLWMTLRRKRVMG